MPTYNKFTVRELRHICDSRGVDHQGLTKKGIVAALRDADEAEEERREEGWNEVESEYREIVIPNELGAGADDGHNGGENVVR